jgi:hypothetical protein
MEGGLADAVVLEFLPGKQQNPAGWVTPNSINARIPMIAK